MFHNFKDQFLFYIYFLNLSFKKKERQLEEEKENFKKLDYKFKEIKTKYEKDSVLLSETVNQKKDLNETVITLEKKVI